MLATDASTDLAALPPAAPAAKISRAATQHFETWTSFVPQAVWVAISEGSMDQIFDHLGKLGLRHPSEQTSAVMSLAILHSTDGYERVQATSPETRMQFLKTVKHAFKHRSKRWAAPESYLVTLPATPHEIANQFPSIYTVAFADGGARCLADLGNRAAQFEGDDADAGSQSEASTDLAAWVPRELFQHYASGSVLVRSGAHDDDERAVAAAATAPVN